LTDCDDATDWGETEDGNTGSTVVDEGDYFKIVITASAGNKVYHWHNGTDIDIAAATYKKILFRYKTSDTSIKAKILLEFDDATNQTVLAETSSVTWATGSATPTTGKTIDHVHLYANQATGTVWYDFVLICEDVFTFPYVSRDGKSGGISLSVKNRYANLKPPKRVGDIHQYLGMDAPQIVLTGDMDTQTGWTAPIGWLLYANTHRAYHEPWQWFTSDLVNCKVVVKSFDISQEAGSKVQRVWRLVLEMYRLSSGDVEVYGDFFEL